MTVAKLTTFADPVLDRQIELITRQMSATATVTPESFSGTAADDSAAIQLAIDSLEAGDVVLAANKTYIAANIKLKSNVNLRGQGGTTIKLPDNCHATSYNGAVADSNGYFANNILCTTLNHDGGAWYDGGARAKDPDNSVYIVENVKVTGIVLDGNKANNTLGDLGENASAMGACVSLHQASRVVVTNCVIKNARLDGVSVGYSLHGGSDDCIIQNNRFIDNGRTGMALVTGKRNKIIGNTVTGTSVALDIEANLTNEINWRHIVKGNHFKGVVSLNALAGSMAGCIVSSNIIETSAGAHGIWLQGGDQTAGVIIANNRLFGDGGSAFNIIGGINSTGVPLMITDNTATGFDYINSASTLTINNVVFRGNATKTKYGFQLMRPYRVTIDGNPSIIFDGGTAASPAFYIQFDQSVDVPDQGEVIISNNKVRGSGLNKLINSITGDTPPTFNSSTLVFTDNDFDVTFASYADPIITIDQETTLRRNKFNNFNSAISFLGTYNGSRFIDNEFINTATRSDLFSIPSLFKRVVISGNRLVNINLKVTRPQYCSISNNTVRNGKMVIAYVTTSGGAGSNTISGNQMVTDEVIDLAFEITGVENTDWAAGNFSGNDIIMGNVHAGPYTTASSMNTTPKTANYNSF